MEGREVDKEKRVQWRTLVGLVAANLVLWFLASRSETFFQSSVIHAVWTATFLALCYEIVLSTGVNPAPLFASFGVLVTVLSFGGQQIVADVLSGFALVLDNNIQTNDRLVLHLKDGTKVPASGTCTVRRAKLTHLVVETPDSRVNVRHGIIHAISMVSDEK